MIVGECERGGGLAGNGGTVVRMPRFSIRTGTLDATSRTFLVVVLAAATGCNCKSTPDQMMLDRFREHRDEFHQVIELLRSDPGVFGVVCGGPLAWSGIVGADGRTEPGKAGSTPERLQQYLKVLRAVGVIRISVVEWNGPRLENDGQVEFVVEDCSPILPRSEKGYRYGALRPLEIEAHLWRLSTTPM